MASGGSGVLLGGSARSGSGKGRYRWRGVVGTQAAKMAVGLGADVAILDNNVQRLRELDDLFDGTLKTIYATSATLERRWC